MKKNDWLGIALPDFCINSKKRAKIFQIDKTTLSFTANNYSNSSSILKANLFSLLILCILVVLISRAFVLQLIKGNYYNAQSEGNRIINRQIIANRGIIFDQKGKALVRNVPYYVSKDQKKYLTSQEYLKLIQEEPNAQNQFTLQPQREYLCAEACAHLLGYVGQISGDEYQNLTKLETNKDKKYYPTDLIGKTGLEYQYEAQLRGVNGQDQIEINAQGKELKLINQKPALSGNSVKTNIDLDLQNFSYQKLKQTIKDTNAQSGAIVVQNIKTGGILTLVSFPSFNPNDFAQVNRTLNLTQYFNDPTKPLLDRAIGGTFAPGSTYKMITALAALESKTIAVDTLVEDTGHILISGTTFNNWYYTQYGKTDGNLNVTKALARSNDIFFYKSALDIGVTKLAEMSRRFNFSKITGIDLPGEVSGIIPTPEWKQKKYHQDWYIGNTINMSIGQGDILVTPLQINSMTTAIARNGQWVTPYLATSFQNTQTKKDCPSVNQKACSQLNLLHDQKQNLNLDKANLQAVQEGMKQVNQKGGTASTFFDYSISTAGKTGTAESSNDAKPHAWYTVYAPYENPEISVTVLLEKGGEGSQVAAPVAKDILDHYFNNSRN